MFDLGTQPIKDDIKTGKGGIKRLNRCKTRNKKTLTRKTIGYESGKKGQEGKKQKGKKQEDNETGRLWTRNS